MRGNRERMWTIQEYDDALIKAEAELDKAKVSEKVQSGIRERAQTALKEMAGDLATAKEENNRRQKQDRQIVRINCTH